MTDRACVHCGLDVSTWTGGVHDASILNVVRSSLRAGVPVTHRAQTEAMRRQAEIFARWRAE